MKTWIEPRLHQLKHEGPADLLNELRALQSAHPDEKVVAGNLAYLEKRADQMQYPQFQAQGWPIGSGIVESGNKLVVEARLKGSGMHWAAEHVDPMLAIRNILCSDRWKVEWPKVATRLRLQTARKRAEHHRARTEAKASLVTKTPPPPLPLGDESPRQILIKLKRFDPPQNSKENPWKKFTYGKALYQRPDPPKN